jgi:acetyl-CoA/propionyl-CoA carboxylase biotin carboxyl carrier protein
MIERVLIANRGEIAVRVARACRDLGLGVVAVYGPGDEDARHVRIADDAYRIDSELPSPYLDSAALVAIASRAGARFVHPGYGFLAENAAFAEACAQASLLFVGPPAHAIAVMGDKVAARAAASAAGVPVLPGTAGPVADAAAARTWAAKAGYPIVLKAAAGGGGRGFRVAEQPEDVNGAFESAQSESERAFGDGRLYAERYLARPRHVEVQIFADKMGTTVALGDRDCSIQRRHQKLIEESPAPNISDPVRVAMAEAAVRLARAVDYVGAGTVEFLVEQDGSFWFLEMNTRIQVEHTVTEEVFGVDLVREQLTVAMGEPLTVGRCSHARGHAIQCRINAEDPGNGFSPAPGLVRRFVAPLGPGIRVDTAVESGSIISDRYDSLIAKVVATGSTRDLANERMRRALDEMVVEGVPSTKSLHRNILASADFQNAALSTSFLADHEDVIPAAANLGTMDAAVDTEWVERVVEVNGRRFQVRLADDLTRTTERAASRPKRKSRPRGNHGTGGGPNFLSPIQGSVLRISKTVGDAVVAGDPIMVVEAMKMENELRAQRDGVISELPVAVGASVKVGDHLFSIMEPAG